jgi:hypothetical protein
VVDSGFRQLMAIRSAIFAGLIMLNSPLAVMADNLILESGGQANQAVLSDGLLNENGQWQTKVQVIFNSRTQRIERRV